MKSLLYFLASCFLFLLSIEAQAQAKTLKSTKQIYLRGIVTAQYNDSSTVIIDYDLDAKRADFKYITPINPVFSDVKSLSLKLAYTDKESNAPAIYAETQTMDKDIASILVYDDKIEVKYRNGNLSTFMGLQPYDKNTKPAAATPAPKTPAAKPKK